MDDWFEVERMRAVGQQRQPHSVIFTFQKYPSPLGWLGSRLKVNGNHIIQLTHGTNVGLNSWNNRMQPTNIKTRQNTLTGYRA
jgi:hypothetical protein